MNTSIILGGGAAGIFAAITIKTQNSKIRVLVFEKTSQLLSKVRISGGGRCNVTHACFDPKKLIENYPRGSKELLGPFTRFQPKDTIAWFEARGVELKTEEDGRIFPVTDSSETIIETLLKEAAHLGVEICRNTTVESIRKEEGFILTLSDRTVTANSIVLATGSHPSGHRFAEHFGHTIIPPVPSLFTLNIPSSPLLELSGLSVAKAALSVEGTTFSTFGPLLLTHFGFSGPAALKLSAFAARDLAEKNYRATILVNWIGNLSAENAKEALFTFKKKEPHRPLATAPLFDLPKNLWKKLCQQVGIEEGKRADQLSNQQLQTLTDKLTKDRFLMEGKTTHKQEFVTAGGVSLKEVSFKTMESTKCPGVYFAGEILDIDAVTGGFNFQNAWTTGWIAGHSIAEK